MSNPIPILAISGADTLDSTGASQHETAKIVFKKRQIKAIASKVHLGRF
jgi:hypothetical protein